MTPLSWFNKPAETGTSKPHGFVAVKLVVGIIGLFYILGGALSQRRGFDPDEFMHIHFSWTMYKGLLPFRDYFDHYTPLYHLFLVPFFKFFKVETSFTDGLAFLFFARKLAWLTSGVVVALTVWLGKLWRNTETGVVAALFLVASEVYWNMSLEIRPDTMATGVWLLFLIALVSATQVAIEGKKKRWIFALSGMILAIGFLTSQKNVYAFPGLAVSMCLYIWKPDTNNTRRDRITSVAFQFAGFCIPLALTAVYFYLQNGLAEFIEYNFFFYLKVPGGTTEGALHQAVYQHPFLAIFGIAGLLRSLWTIFEKPILQRAEFILAPATLSLIFGLYLIPTPYYQYYLLFLPLVAIFAAAFLLDSVGTLSVLRDRLIARQWQSIAALTGILILGLLCWIARNAHSPWPLFVILGYWLGALAAGLTLIFRRATTLALVVFFAAMILGPLVRFKSALAKPVNSVEIDEMRYVMENTTPTETVMDGYRGGGTYRPHAFFFWFLPLNERSGIPEEKKERLVANLYEGTVAPKLILMDFNLRALSPKVTEFFENNYEPVGVGVLWKRKR